MRSAPRRWCPPLAPGPHALRALAVVLAVTGARRGTRPRLAGRSTFEVVPLLVVINAHRYAVTGFGADREPAGRRVADVADAARATAGQDLDVRVRPRSRAAVVSQGNQHRAAVRRGHLPCWHRQCRGDEAERAGAVRVAGEGRSVGQRQRAQPDPEVLAVVPQRGRARHHGPRGGAGAGLDDLASRPWSQHRAARAAVGRQVAAGELPQLRVLGRRGRRGGIDTCIQPSHRVIHRAQGVLLSVTRTEPGHALIEVGDRVIGVAVTVVVDAEREPVARSGPQVERPGAAKALRPRDASGATAGVDGDQRAEPITLNAVLIDQGEHGSPVTALVRAGHLTRCHGQRGRGPSEPSPLGLIARRPERVDRRSG